MADQHPAVTAVAEALAADPGLRAERLRLAGWTEHAVPDWTPEAAVAAPAVLRWFAAHMRTKAEEGAPDGAVGWPWTGYALAARHADAEADEIERTSGGTHA